MIEQFKQMCVRVCVLHILTLTARVLPSISLLKKKMFVTIILIIEIIIIIIMIIQVTIITIIITY